MKPLFKKEITKMVLSLEDVFESAKESYWKYELFIAKDKPITLQTKCALVDVDKEENPDKPKIAMKNTLIYCLPFQDVLQIIENAKLQVKSISKEKLLEAFVYYYKNDSFIDFSKQK